MRVVVADDHSLFRDGIISLLEAAEYEVVAQVGDGVAALEAVRRHKPDLALLDISMPEMNGLEALEKIKAESPGTKVVMLTVSDADEDLFKSIEIGADGYLLKDLDAGEFLSILDGINNGEAAVTRKIAARIMGRVKDLAQQNEDEKGGLSPREVEVLALLGDGLPNRAIAERLFVSENTVKYHVRNILQKLGAQNRTEAVAHAMRMGLIDQDLD
ncbi:MAG: response regulator transcription factor [Anaerolineales bacterium]|nr:response regulator transcription factor [Chloroflexota bacterium]MBL6982766.1 response regulator transcription factor [Anaerolineales bacterium]